MAVQLPLCWPSVREAPSWSAVAAYERPRRDFGVEFGDSAFISVIASLIEGMWAMLLLG